MTTHVGPVTLGVEGRGRRHTDILRPTLRAVVPREGLESADVYVVGERAIKWFGVDGLFTSPFVDGAKIQDYSEGEPWLLLPPPTLNRVHILESSRTSDVIPLRPANVEEWNEASVWVRTPEAQRRFEITARALSFVADHMRDSGISPAA